MGYAIAIALANKGASVKLVSGPTHLHIMHPHIDVIAVRSADEMFEKSKEIFPTTNMAVFAAAVADYRPKEVAKQKIKKEDSTPTIELIKTIDIAATLGKLKKKGQILVGFALETENESANALKKLETKNFDLVVLNSLQDEGAGFGHDTNKISIIDSNQKTDFELKSKTEVAKDILKAIIDKLELRKNPVLDKEVEKKEDIKKPIAHKKFEINKEEEF